MEVDKQNFQTSTHQDRRDLGRALLHSCPKPTPWKSTTWRVTAIPGFLKYLPKKGKKEQACMGCAAWGFQHFNATNDQYPNKEICPCENSEGWNIYFPACFLPWGILNKNQMAENIFSPCWPLVHFRCEFKFLLTHKHKQVISSLLFSCNARNRHKIKYLRVSFWAAYFLIFSFSMDSLFDFVKHQLKSALPGPL